MRWVGIGMAIFMLLVVGETAQASDYVDNLEVRPDVGYGYAVSKNHERGMGYHAGLRVFSDVRSFSTPEPRKRWGISLTEVSPFESEAALRHRKYLALGIMLEQTLPADLVATIGTLGYIGRDRNENKPYGLLTEIGWEPAIGKDLHGFVALRFETIYDTSSISRYALSAGMKYTIF